MENFFEQKSASIRTTADSFNHPIGESAQSTNFFSVDHNQLRGFQPFEQRDGDGTLADHLRAELIGELTPTLRSAYEREKNLDDAPVPNLVENELLQKERQIWSSAYDSLSPAEQHQLNQDVITYAQQAGVDSHVAPPPSMESFNNKIKIATHDFTTNSQVYKGISKFWKESTAPSPIYEGIEKYWEENTRLKLHRKDHSD